MEISLRPYQQQVFDAVQKTEKRGIKRQLSVLSTGLGKSYLTVFIILKKLKENKRTLILVDQEELVWQWKNYIHNVDSSISIGIEKAEYKAKKSDQVVIATVQTLGRKGVKRIKRFSPNHFQFCVIDEAHKSIAKTWFRVLDYFGFGKDNFTDGNLLYGTTATPFRSSGESLGLLFDDIIANYDLKFAISEGWLTDISLYDIQTNTDLSKFKNQGEFDDAVNNSDRNLQALKAYKEICDGEQALVYCASVDHAYELEKLFNANGVPSAVIEANTSKSERKDYLQDYKDKDIKCIFNYSTMTTGVDLPETSTLMLLRPIQSKLLLTQTLGRGLRPSSTAHIDVWTSREERLKALELSAKPFCKVIDLHDKVGKHNFAHIPSLFGLHNELKSPKKKQFFKEVVEPIEKARKEHGVDPATIKDVSDIDLIVKNRKLEIKSLKLSPEVEQFTDRTWVDVGDGYEIIYGKEHKALIIEKDSAKGGLIDKEEWHLLEHDLKNDVTKKLQTFNSLSGAFKIADEYADENRWSSAYKKKAEWMNDGVTEGQMRMLNKFFVYKYKKGHPKEGQVKHSKFKLLDEKYPDTHMRKVFWKDTNEVLNKGTASKLINAFFNNRG